MIAQNISVPKKNALMELFCKRQAQSIINKTTIKKIKTNQSQQSILLYDFYSKQDDPLYKILSWRDNYIQYQRPKENTYKIIKSKSIIKADQTQWAQKVQAIWINIDWNHISMNQLTQLELSDQLIHNGIVFIWGAKTNIGQIMDYFEKMNFFYVENFTFAILNRNKIPQKSQKTIKGNKSILNFFSVNKPSLNELQNISLLKQQKDYQIDKVQNVNTIFCNENSKYFKQTQKVLYMFRKVQKNQPLQLRHQRTSDVYFTIGNSLKLDWKAKQIVYKMIQTLLISANYKDKQPFKLVQLWGDQQKPRKGWVTVVEDKQQQINSSDKATMKDIQE